MIGQSTIITTIFTSLLCYSRYGKEWKQAATIDGVRGDGTGTPHKLMIRGHRGLVIVRVQCVEIEGQQAMTGKSLIKPHPNILFLRKHAHDKLREFGEDHDKQKDQKDVHLVRACLEESGGNFLCAKS